jgi:adenylate kinase
MGFSYLLGGVNGVGKSAVFEGIRDRRPDITLVHTAGALMTRLGVEAGDYDRFRALPRGLKNQENGVLIEGLVGELGPDQTVVFDAHYLDLIDGCLKPTIEGDWPRILSGLALLESSPEAVQSRLADDQRERRLFRPDGVLSAADKVNTLSSFISATRQEFGRLVASFTLPSVVIRNEPGELTTAVDAFLRFDDSVRAMVR